MGQKSKAILEFPVVFFVGGGGGAVRRGVVQSHSKNFFVQGTDIF